MLWKKWRVVKQGAFPRVAGYIKAGKIALVTGGNSGIGFGAAKCLEEVGAFFYITGRRKEQ